MLNHHIDPVALVILEGKIDQVRKDKLRANPPSACVDCGTKLTKNHQDYCHPDMCQSCVSDLRGDSNSIDRAEFYHGKDR
jgi:hypothetical protein